MTHIERFYSFGDQHAITKWMGA